MATTSSTASAPAQWAGAIVELARAGAALLAGIARHVSARGAPRIDLPLALLRELRSRADKNTWLADWTRAKLERRQVRCCRYSTFGFAE